ncbi:MAG: hypothetical protein DBY27_05540 [Clostridiaceae bacterium]|nr:MAG: hypothetical protein DBY27_05540 [Clostridiaceae bacterium]
MQRNKALISGRDGEIRQLNLAECIDCFPNTSIVKVSVLLSNMSDFQSVYFEFQRVWTCQRNLAESSVVIALRYMFSLHL